MGKQALTASFKDYEKVLNSLSLTTNSAAHLGSDIITSKSNSVGQSNSDGKSRKTNLDQAIFFRFSSGGGLAHCESGTRKSATQQLTEA